MLYKSILLLLFINPIYFHSCNIPRPNESGHHIGVVILGPLRDYHPLFFSLGFHLLSLSCALLFSDPPLDYLKPLPPFFLSYPLYPLGGLWVSTVARPPAFALEQVVPPPASLAQTEVHLGFGPASLGLGGWPDLPPLWSLNNFQTDTLMQSGQFLNTYYTWQKLYPPCLSPGCFPNWELVEHSQPQLV